MSYSIRIGTQNILDSQIPEFLLPGKNKIKVVWIIQDQGGYTIWDTRIRTSHLKKFRQSMIKDKSRT